MSPPTATFVDSPRSDSARSDSARSDSARSDSARSDSARSDSARSNLRSVDKLASATLGKDRQSRGEQIALTLFIAVPFLALLAAIPVAWGWGLGWRDVVIAVAMYA